MGCWAVESGSVDTLPDAKGLQMGGDEKDRPLAASTSGRAGVRAGVWLEARPLNLLTISDLAPTMNGNGGRQDANSTQGQDGRAAAATPPVGTIGSRDFSCGGITEVPEMFNWQLVDGEHGWFFRLRAQNGNIICTSEIYSSREAAEDTLRSLSLIHI